MVCEPRASPEVGQVAVYVAVEPAVLTREIGAVVHPLMFEADEPEGVSVNRTVPPGVMAPAGNVMLAVNVTEVLIVEVLPLDEEPTVRLVAALLTTCCNCGAAVALLL